MREFVFWFLVLYGIERLLETFWKREKVEGRIVAAYTLYLLVGALSLVYVATLWGWFSWEERQPSSWVALTGIALVIVSIAGRNWAIRTLGLHHSIHIEIREKHELIQLGPYRYVRNPYYLSNVIEAVGLPLAAGAMFAMLISLFLYIPLLVLRTTLEETALEKKFAESFVRYKAQVPRMFPKLF